MYSHPRVKGSMKKPSWLPTVFSPNLTGSAFLETSVSPRAQAKAINLSRHSCLTLVNE
jgi:hypothetical protein